MTDYFVHGYHMPDDGDGSIELTTEVALSAKEGSVALEQFKGLLAAGEQMIEGDIRLFRLVEVGPLLDGFPEED